MGGLFNLETKGGRFLITSSSAKSDRALQRRKKFLKLLLGRGEKKKVS